MSDFLLEIGTEEIPHWMIPGALAQLEKWAEKELPTATIKVDATPRRLVVRASGVPANQMSSEEIVWGPPKNAPAAAVEGFAKKSAIAVAELEIRAKGKGEYFSFVKRTEGLAYSLMLAQHLPNAVLGIQWPKTMRWTEAKNIDFVRPIRWIVALFDNKIIDFEIAGVKSGNLSRGHRVLANTEIKVDYASFEDVLAANKVILSAEKRRTKIENEAKALGATIEPELLETLTYITGFPAAIKGDFDPAYLELPAEVLTMVMRHHQKYFAVESAPGVLAPHFVAVMNVPADPDGLVKRGNERVLKARFNDARFFWEVDQKKKLADRVEDLSHVTFQAKLGSYLEKTHRVVALVKELGGDEDAQRAALLAKADLTTEMVKEFTDLQGIVGGLYAKHQGEPEAVSQAIYEHYKPLSMEDSIPSTRAGQILAIADKLDNLREFFRIDMVPTGSKDPFALRRAAQGVIKILAEANLHLPFADLSLGNSALGLFMFSRVEHYFQEIKGFAYDEVRAVRGDHWHVRTIPDFEDRLTALRQVRSTKDFEPLAASFKRIKNIVGQAQFAPQGPINQSLLENGPERDLFEKYLEVSAVARSSQTPYRKALEEIASMRPQVDGFFDKILVNAQDASVRENRLTLLYNILKEFSTIADFSEIVTSGDTK